MGTCDPLGIPRLLNTEVITPHQTMEIVQIPGRMLQFFEWHHDWREVFIDRQLPAADTVEPTWNGTSVGKWDGDVFVVDSIGFDDRTWLDKFGHPHSENMKLQERYRRVDADTLELTMTLTDPEMYARPWVSDTKLFRLDRAKSSRWDEQIYCVPTEEYKFNQRVRDEAGGRGTQSETRTVCDGRMRPGDIRLLAVGTRPAGGNPASCCRPRECPFRSDRLLDRSGHGRLALSNDRRTQRRRRRNTCQRRRPQSRCSLGSGKR